jgi:hypothetical protein
MLPDLISYFVVFSQLLLLVTNYFAFTELVCLVRGYIYIYGVRRWFTNLLIALVRIITVCD